jgi:hypothetical protein
MTIKQLRIHLDQFPEETKIFTNNPESAPGITNIEPRVFNPTKGPLYSLDIDHNSQYPEIGETVLIIF